MIPWIVALQKNKQKEKTNKQNPLNKQKTITKTPTNNYSQTFANQLCSSVCQSDLHKECCSQKPCGKLNCSPNRNMHLQCVTVIRSIKTQILSWAACNFSVFRGRCFLPVFFLLHRIETMPWLGKVYPPQASVGSHNMMYRIHKCNYNEKKQI